MANHEQTHPQPSIQYIVTPDKRVYGIRSFPDQDPPHSLVMKLGRRTDSDFFRNYLDLAHATSYRHNILTTNNNNPYHPEILTLGLPRRAAYALFRGNIFSEEQLASATTDELRRIRGINKKFLTAIQELYMI